MGNQQMKPEEKLKYINIEVNSLRASIRRTRKAATKALQEDYYQSLVKYSKEASSLKGKVREGNLKRTQENISKTVTEVLSIPIPERDSNLDSGAIETDSFIEVPMSRRRSSSKAPLEIPMKKSGSKRNTMSKHVSTLEDIDLKFKSLKPQIKTAIDNKDNTQLRVHKKTIEVLATDLEMIEIFGDTPLGDRKEKLVSSLTSQYQKVNSAMKDIRRSKDIDYLLEQNSNTLMKKLEEIRKELNKTDATLKEALKNEDFNTIGTAKENLVKINQRLSSLEVVDENTKRMKMQMVDQITWLYKYMNDFTQKGSQSDLTKAQVNYEDLIKNIASGKNKNENDIKVKLESLQSFVNTIDDVDESDSKKKKQLLNNINDTFSSFAGIGKKEMDFPQVDGSKQTDNEKAIDLLKEVNKFCESIERSIKQVKLTETEFDNLIRILGNVMRSIESTRENIAANKPKLNKMLNYSTPDLTVPKSSQVELNTRSNTIGNVTKTNVRVYDLETSKKETAESHKVVTGFDRDENCFSAVDQIRTQVNYIKEKINEIEDDTHVRNKLTTFRKTLQTYSNHTNQTIANNAKLVSADIQELLTNISNNQEIKQIYLYGKIETIQDSFEHMKKIVEEFFDKRESDSFEMITEQLLMCEKYLAANKKITKDQKDEVISKFRSLMKTFEKKANIQETLTSLKDRVNRFAGAYKGVLYNKIEKDMNKIIIDASEHIDNKKISDEITTQTEKHLKILENRATRDQSFRRTISGTPLNLDEGKIMKLRAEIENIRHDMETIASNDVDSFIHVKSRLDLVTLELAQLKKYNENEEQMKISIQNEVDALKIIVDAKIATAMESLKVLLIKKDENTEDKLKTRLDTIERNLNVLKVEIEQFVGTTSDNKFYELDEKAIRLILKINDMEGLPEGSDFHDRKVTLMKEAQQCSDILNKRANETETLIDYERSISDIENNFDHYSKSTKDLEKLAEHIKLVKEDLERTNFNRNLKERKQSCVEQIDSVVKKIGDRSGTEQNMTSYTTAPDERTKQIVDEYVVTSTEDQINGKSEIEPLKIEDLNRAANRQNQNNTDNLKQKREKNKMLSEDAYIGSASFLKDVERNRTKKPQDETNPVILELEEIEKVTERLTKEIAVFDNLDTSEEYQQLEDNILKLNVRLNLLNIREDDLFYSRKLEVEQKISNCLDYLDKRMQSLEIISGVEIELNKVSKSIEEWTTKEENNVLDEKLIDLQVTLGKIHLDDEPNQRKSICTEEIKKYLRKLKENREIIHDTSV